MGITSSRDPKTEDGNTSYKDPKTEDGNTSYKDPKSEDGITSSKDPKSENFESSPGKSLVRSDKLPIDWEDPDRAFTILMLRELYALFPSELEDETERFMDYNEKVTEFLKGGDCKEVTVSLEDCCNKAKDINDCDEPFKKLWDCMYSHPKYYQPYITAVDKVDEEMAKHGC